MTAKRDEGTPELKSPGDEASRDIASTQLRNERGSSDDGEGTTKGTDVRIASSPGQEEKGDFLGGHQ